ncbi:unnamed protein product [Calypogeia fissa]
MAEGGGGDGGGHADAEDAVLMDFLSSLQNYTPTIPDELAEHYLSRSGFSCPDMRVVRLVSLAAQKFVGEIASDAMQYCKIRQGSARTGEKSRGHKDKRFVLTNEDLMMALREYGVNLKQQEYFTDSPATGGAGASSNEKTDK